MVCTGRFIACIVTIEYPTCRPPKDNFYDYDTEESDKKKEETKLKSKKRAGKYFYLYDICKCGSIPICCLNDSNFLETMVYTAINFIVVSHCYISNL